MGEVGDVAVHPGGMAGPKTTARSDCASTHKPKSLIRNLSADSHYDSDSETQLDAALDSDPDEDSDKRKSRVRLKCGHLFRNKRVYLWTNILQYWMGSKSIISSYLGAVEH